MGSSNRRQSHTYGRFAWEGRTEDEPRPFDGQGVSHLGR